MEKRAKSVRFGLEEHLLVVGLALVAVFWVIESVLDTYVFVEWDLLSTLFLVQPAQLWDHGLLAVALLLLISCAQKAMSERRRDEELQPLMEPVFESSEDLKIGKNLDGAIVSWDRDARRIYDYSANEALGRLASSLIPFDCSDEVPTIIERTRQGERVDQYETVQVRRGGDRIYLSATVSLTRTLDSVAGYRSTTEG